MLEVRGLRKSYGDVDALRGVDLDIAAGEICGLLGPNGAGKTTLVSIVAGLRKADAGTVTLNGVDALRNPFAARRSLGLAPQDLGVYPTVRLRDNLVCFGELADLRGSELRERVDWVGDLFELTPFMDRLVRTLSGGEKRRLHTAMAVLHRPPLLLLDEATTGVDVRTRSRVLDAVRQLAAEDGTAICYSTHYLNEVELLGASVAIIEQGQVIARGALGELVRVHGTAAVELTFEGEPPVLELGRRVETDGSMLRVYGDEPAADAAVILGQLGPHASRLRSIELVAPSLESVFLALTGRRYTDDDATQEEEDDVVAS
ncbi:MAG TPA: ABC transporter ATP-binding protein [Acidimicrobiia bacterium]|nr:ABC transporter ATP-binding protein [Acidimicrobiia bacterium]